MFVPRTPPSAALVPVKVDLLVETLLGERTGAPLGVSSSPLVTVFVVAVLSTALTLTAALPGPTTWSSIDDNDASAAESKL